jgi:hypothetical protein
MLNKSTTQRRFTTTPSCLCARHVHIYSIERVIALHQNGTPSEAIFRHVHMCGHVVAARDHGQTSFRAGD